MKQWEYKTEEVRGVMNFIGWPSFLNGLGAEGWELVEIMRIALEPDYLFIFKREKYSYYKP